jgi:hypothetical protein
LVCIGTLLLVLLNDVGIVVGLLAAGAPAVIANVGPVVLAPLIRPFRSSNDKLFVSDSFLPVNSLIND